MAALPPHGETNLPSTSTLPESSNQPQNPSATAPAPVSAGGQLDRMQAEVQALQQQAQATQQSLKKLQTRESAGPYNAIVSDLPGAFSGVNSTMLGVGSGLMLAGVVVWWYVWHRPRTRWIDAPPAAKRKEEPTSTRAPLSQNSLSLHSPNSTQPPHIAVQEDALAWDSSTVSGDTTQPYESGHSPFARREPNIEFDPEAAAGEVTRVRKSLADKREARAQLKDREDSVSAALDLDLDLGMDGTPAPLATETPSVRAWLDSEIASKAFAGSGAHIATAELDLDLDVSDWQSPQPPAPLAAPAPAADESVSFSLVDDEPPEPVLELEVERPSEPKPEAKPEPHQEQEPEPEPELALVPESTPMHTMDHEFGRSPAPQESGAKSYDFTITMALAQESAALELWNEARDLASEVLESDDPKLVSEALSLLERLNLMDLEAPQDAQPGNGVR